MTACFICSRKAEVVTTAGGGKVECELCGEYQFTDMVRNRLIEDAQNSEVTPKLAAFTREQNLRGNIPCFYSESGNFPQEVTIEEAT
ncbi:MAG: hypothetical protein KGZ25_02225 [Planctomycetes bacterium]|nr:hypothetical protein [Planctomycetota bacterium]